MSQAPSGIDTVPSIPWGTHITHFFSTGDELRDLLVPYFRAGLENNERCLWVTGGAFDAKQARVAMRSVVPNFDEREQAKQIEIHDADRFYASGQKFQAHTIVDGLKQAERRTRSIQAIQVFEPAAIAPGSSARSGGNSRITKPSFSMR